MCMRDRNNSVFGIPISRDNAKKLAQDLVILQASIYRKTSKAAFLDHDPAQGHTNYELHKFGQVLAREIKNDLRNLTSHKKLQFYVFLLDECWKQNNYELGARVYQGINDAIKRDEFVLQKGDFEIPQEDAEIKKVRDEITKKLSKVRLWKKLENKVFPNSASSKALYLQHLNERTPFVPSAQAIMNFIAIRLDNAKNILRDDDALPHVKYNRMQEVKKEISSELDFIERVIKAGMPASQKMNFPSLEEKFADQLTMNISNLNLPIDQILDEKLGLHELKEVLNSENRQHQKQKRVHLKPEYQKKPAKEQAAPHSRFFQSQSKRQKRVFLKKEYQKPDQKYNPDTSPQSSVKHGKK